MLTVHCDRQLVNPDGMLRLVHKLNLMLLQISSFMLICSRLCI